MANVSNPIFTRLPVSTEERPDINERNAAQSFSRIFAGLMAKQMRQSMIGDAGIMGTTGGATGDIYGSFMDDALAKAMASSAAMKPLNEMVSRQLNLQPSKDKTHAATSADVFADADAARTFNLMRRGISPSSELSNERAPADGSARPQTTSVAPASADPNNPDASLQAISAIDDQQTDPVSDEPPDGVIDQADAIDTTSDPDSAAAAQHSSDADCGDHPEINRIGGSDGSVQSKASAAIDFGSNAVSAPALQPVDAKLPQPSVAPADNLFASAASKNFFNSVPTTDSNLTMSSDRRGPILPPPAPAPDSSILPPPPLMRTQE